MQVVIVSLCRLRCVDYAVESSVDDDGTIHRWTREPINGYLEARSKEFLSWLRDNATLDGYKDERNSPWMVDNALLTRITCPIRSRFTLGRNGGCSSNSFASFLERTLSWKLFPFGQLRIWQVCFRKFFHERFFFFSVTLETNSLLSLLETNFISSRKRKGIFSLLFLSSVFLQICSLV